MKGKKNSGNHSKKVKKEYADGCSSDSSSDGRQRRVSKDEVGLKKEDAPDVKPKLTLRITSTVTPSTTASSKEDIKPVKRKGQKSEKKNSKANRKKRSKSCSRDSSDSSDSSSDSSDSEHETDSECNPFSSCDLPDLPTKWDRSFKKMNSYVPLSIFKRSYINSLPSSSSSKREEKNSETDTILPEIEAERQFTFGDFLEASHFEARYAKEIYGLDEYATYIKQHQKIVISIEKRYQNWMIALRYHIAIRRRIFRRRNAIVEKRKKGKKQKKRYRIVLLKGLQEDLEREAKWKVQAAGDSMFEGNPYAPGQPKYGFDFFTGERVATSDGDQSESSGSATDRQALASDCYHQWGDARHGYETRKRKRTDGNDDNPFQRDNNQNQNNFSYGRPNHRYNQLHPQGYGYQIHQHDFQDFHNQ